jgi:hypothetical protein
MVTHRKIDIAMRDGRRQANLGEGGMKNQRLLEISEWALLATATLGCLMTLRVAIYQFVVPYQLNYEEGNILNAAVRIIQGANPYPAIQPPIYVFNTYGPVVYYLITPPVKHFGPVFLYPRVLICIAGSIITALIVVLLRRAGISLKMSRSFGLLYLTLPVVQDWVYLLRVDLVGIVFTLAGLGVCWAIPRRWYLAAPLFVAAIFSKYNLIAAPAACCVFFAFRKEWYKAAGLAACVGGPSLFLFSVLEKATRGWFAFHMFRTHPDPYFFLKWAEMFLPALGLHAVLMILVIVLEVEDMRRHRVSLPMIYFSLAIAGYSDDAYRWKSRIGHESSARVARRAVPCGRTGLPRPEAPHPLRMGTRARTGGAFADRVVHSSL